MRVNRKQFFFKGLINTCYDAEFVFCGSNALLPADSTFGVPKSLNIHLGSNLPQSEVLAPAPYLAALPIRNIYSMRASPQAIYAESI
jgi:hypothetical protein